MEHLIVHLDFHWHLPIVLGHQSVSVSKRLLFYFFLPFFVPFQCLNCWRFYWTCRVQHRNSPERNFALFQTFLLNWFLQFLILQLFFPFQSNHTIYFLFRVCNDWVKYEFFRFKGAFKLSTQYGGKLSLQIEGKRYFLKIGILKFRKFLFWIVVVRGCSTEKESSLMIAWKGISDFLLNVRAHLISEGVVEFNFSVVNSFEVVLLGCH